MIGRRCLVTGLAFLAALSAGTHSLAAQVGARGDDRQGGDPLAEIRKSLPTQPEAARIALTEALWEAVREVGSAELMLARSLEAGDSIKAEAQRELASKTVDARELLVALMDTIVFETEWGGTELERLRRRYPTSSFFLRYEAEVRKRGGDLEGALTLIDRLLGMRSTVAELQRERAGLLEELGRAEDAIGAYTRALEIEPEDEIAFRALVRLRQEHGTLPALLEQVRRLRTIFPDSPKLAERETEILHRLGLPAGEGASARQPREELS